MEFITAKLYIKSKDKTMDVLYTLKKYGVDSKNFFNQLKDKGYFELNLEDELITKLKEELKDAITLEITNTEFTKSKDTSKIVERNKEKKLQSSAGILVLLLFDTFVIISILEIFSKSIDFTSLINTIIQIYTFTLILETGLKISIGFVFIKGILDIADTTILGKILNIKIEEGKKNFSLIMLLLIIAYYFLNSNLIILKYFGLFAFIFIIIAVLFASEYLEITLEKYKNQ